MSNTTKVIVIVGGTILLLMGCSSLGLSLLLSSEMSGDGDITVATMLCFALPGLLFSGLGVGMIYQAWRSQVAQQHNQHAFNPPHGTGQGFPPHGAGQGFPPPGTGQGFPSRGTGQGFPSPGADWSADYVTGHAPVQQGNAGIDEQIWQAAARRDYRITANDVAMLADLSLERARDRLEEMVQQGIVTAEIGANREIVYTFRRP